MNGVEIAAFYQIELDRRRTLPINEAHEELKATRPGANQIPGLCSAARIRMVKTCGTQLETSDTKGGWMVILTG